MRQEVEARRGEVSASTPGSSRRKSAPSVPCLKAPDYRTRGRQRLFHFFDRFRRKTFGFEGGVVDSRCLAERAVDPTAVSFDLGNIGFAIAGARAGRFRHGRGCYLEVAAAGEFF